MTTSNTGIPDLARIRPLVGLLSLQSDPDRAVTMLLEHLDRGEIEGATGLFHDPSLASSCLRHSEIISSDRSGFTASARDRIIEARTLLAVRRQTHDQWIPVLTVPPFARSVLAAGTVVETAPALRRLMTAARNHLIIASPFLDSEADALLSRIPAFVAAGGHCLVLTQGLRRSGYPDNRTIIDRLRRSTTELTMNERTGGLDIVSWDDGGLGVHMKVVVADGRAAYVGSANLTRGGLSSHAEIGVHLAGPSVAPLEQYLLAMAEEVRTRSRSPGQR